MVFVRNGFNADRGVHPIGFAVSDFQSPLVANPDSALNSLKSFVPCPTENEPDGDLSRLPFAFQSLMQQSFEIRLVR